MTPEETLVSRILACGVCPTEISGCTRQEIGHIETAVGCRLPVVYVRFLSLIGRGAGEFMSDVTAFYPGLIALTERCRRLTAEFGILPDDAFVFAGRSGEQFLFFRLKEPTADPAVYRWTDERPRRTKKVFNSFWDFVEEELSGFEQMTSQ